MTQEVLTAFAKPTYELDVVGTLGLKTRSEAKLVREGLPIIRTPDLLVQYRPPLAQEKDFKEVAVLEVGFTQSYNNLRGLVDVWFESRPSPKTVLIIKVTESPRYVRHTNVRYVLEQGVEHFPSVDNIHIRDIQGCKTSHGALSIYKMPVLGRITAFMEVWVREPTTGKPMLDRERIVRSQRFLLCNTFTLHGWIDGHYADSNMFCLSEFLR